MEGCTKHDDVGSQAATTCLLVFEPSQGHWRCHAYVRIHENIIGKATKIGSRQDPISFSVRIAQLGELGDNSWNICDSEFPPHNANQIHCSVTRTIPLDQPDDTQEETQTSPLLQILPRAACSSLFSMFMSSLPKPNPPSICARSSDTNEPSLSPAPSQRTFVLGRLRFRSDYAWE